MPRPTSAQHLEIVNAELDAADSYEIVEAVRVLALRLRTPQDIAELNRIRQAAQCIRERALEHRRRHSPRSTNV